MKKIQLVIFLLSLSLFIGCKDGKKYAKTPDLIKVGYYPTFHVPANVILNVKEKYLVFYSSMDYVSEPPPQDHSREALLEYKTYLKERPRLNPFKVDLTNEDISKINEVFKNFKLEEETNQIQIDGINNSMLVVYNNDELLQITSPINNADTLYQTILNLLIEKNTDKNNAIILEQINHYQ